MAEKIFISYNHNDQVIVDTIVRRLEIEFGSDNIFYDVWSIQPGDSIIEKMNSGLSEFTTFFFFVSPQSLESKMVKLEWQTALNRAVNKNLKFIAVRIGNCSMPAILTDKLYIDLYGEGLDTAIEKMRRVLKKENTYIPQKDIQNIRAVVTQIDVHNIDIIIKAEYFVVHNPIIAIGLNITSDQFEITPTSEGFVMSGKDLITTSDDEEFHSIRFGLYHSLVPGHPFVAKIKLNKDIDVPITLGLFIAEEKTTAGFYKYRYIPVNQDI